MEKYKKYDIVFDLERIFKLIRVEKCVVYYLE